jgi:23S rRNA U2552 (ribose-2'-O)-methylase RlmE/FtsJ
LRRLSFGKSSFSGHTSNQQERKKSQHTTGSEMATSSSKMASSDLATGQEVPPSPPASPKRRIAGNTRVFVGSLPADATSTNIETHFSKYGSVDYVHFVPGKFCFVNFDQETGVQAALDDKRYNVRPARDRQLSKKRKREGAGHTPRQLMVQQFVKSPLFATPRDILVLQCNKSHLERCQDYLQSNPRYNVESTMESMSIPKSTVSLLLIETNDPMTLSSTLAEDVYWNNALNSVFHVHNQIAVGDWTKLVDRLKEQLQATMDDENLKSIDCKIQAFPPKLQAKLCDKLWDEKIPNADFSPTKYTHVLSVVQLDTDHYVTGVTATTSTAGSNYRAHGSDVVCRAYYKLQEALERYPISSTFLKDKVGIDCGASPGGWTKYLIEQGCRQVYSIDPGALDESISQIENVLHYRMGYQEALPSLATQGIQCDVMVSDMCLHVLEHSLDLLSEATPLLKSGALVVLTLKCIAGYSHSSYNGQVAELVERMEQLERVQILHLFANRTAERTVIGFWK